MMNIELSGNAIDFFKQFPDELKDATKTALLDIGMQGAGFAKNVAPVKTGNLRRTIGYSGADNFPFFAPHEGDFLPEFGNSSLYPVDDTVYIGTNIVYSFPMERMYNYMEFTEQYLEQNVIERVFDREITRKLEGK